MAANKKNNEVLNQLSMFDAGYKFHLQNFDGPLDLLLHLIKESKMEIFEVNLSEITEQYLAYLEELDTLDMDKAADFIDVASTLVEIKSKSLLPKLESEDGEDDIDPATKLRQQIMEYKLFKDVCERLKVYENVDRFYKAPDEKVNDFRFVLQDMKLDGLLNAFANVLTRITVEEKEVEPKKIVRDRWTVAEKIESIQTTLTFKEKVKFTELFDSDYSKGEVINVFLALLELLKRQVIRVKQEDNYDDIEIVLREEETTNVE